MSLNTQTFQDFVNQFINQWAASTGLDPILNPGSPVLALGECNAANAMYLQFQAQFTCNFARLQTSSGPDVDSFVEQFSGFGGRDGAQFASGDITLSIPLPASQQIVIPVGVIVQTTAGGIQYQLVADTGQAAYNIGLNAYVLAVSQTSITASVQALVAGSASNVQVNQLNQFGTSSYGITTATNVAAISNGEDQESDAELKARFELYIQSLSKATYDAILEICETTFPAFTYAILNNTTAQGLSQPGYFTVVVNNPGQTVDSGQITTLFAALQNVRAFTVQAGVVAAIPVTPNIVLNVSLLPNSPSTTLTTIQTALLGYINSLPSGAKLYINNLVTVAQNSSSFVTSVEDQSVTINGQPEDFSVDEFHVVQATVFSVLIGTYSG